MAFNKTLADIRLKREYLSDYLYHFTKNADAFDTLRIILGEGELKDMGQKGVICFTEAPFPMLINMFGIFMQYVNPLYAPYGIAIKKSVLFELGARPVIYGTANQRCLLDTSIQWRFEPYHPVHHDFTWLREWRIPLRSVSLNPDDCFVITEKENDLSVAFNHEDILDIEPDVDVSDRGIKTVYMLGKVPRRYKGISMEKLQEIGQPTNAAMADQLLSQSFTDIQYVNLGILKND